MLRRAVLATVAAGLVVFPATAFAKGQIFFEDTVPSGTSSYVRFNTHRPASFRILLRVPTDGRARLFLLGKKAPKGGPLVDTKTSSCEGAAGSFFCKGVVRAASEGDVRVAHQLARTPARARRAHRPLVVARSPGGPGG